MELTAENVNKVLTECLFVDGEDTSNHVVGNGVRLKVGLNPDRVNENKENITSMLSELPDDFKEGFGGGSSFLNACMTKDGDQWGEHSNIDELLCLGTAIGKISYLFPKNMWSALPGGMPYFTVLNKQPELVSPK